MILMIKHSHIHTWLKEEGVNRSRKEGNMKVIRRNIQEDVMRDYDKGILTLEQIGDKYGISGASINRFISTTTNKRDMSYRKLLFVKRGPHSHNWRGGKKNSKYCHKFDNSLRERVRAWWGYQCAICGKTQEENKYRLYFKDVLTKQTGKSNKLYDLEDIEKLPYIDFEDNL